MFFRPYRTVDEKIDGAVIASSLTSTSQLAPWSKPNEHGTSPKELLKQFSSRCWFLMPAFG